MPASALWWSTAVVAFVVAPAVAATNVPRPEIGATPASKGLTYEAAHRDHR